MNNTLLSINTKKEVNYKNFQRMKLQFDVEKTQGKQRIRLRDSEKNPSDDHLGTLPSGKPNCRLMIDKSETCAGHSNQLMIWIRKQKRLILVVLY